MSLKDPHTDVLKDIYFSGYVLVGSSDWPKLLWVQSLASEVVNKNLLKGKASYLELDKNFSQLKETRTNNNRYVVNNDKGNSPNNENNYNT